MSDRPRTKRISRYSRGEPVSVLSTATLAAVKLRTVGEGQSAARAFRELGIARLGVLFGTFRALVTRLRRDAKMTAVRSGLRGRRPDRMSPRQLPKAVQDVARKRTLELGYSATSTYRTLRLAGFGVKENTFVKYIAEIRGRAGLPGGKSQSRRHIVARAVAAIVVGEFDSVAEIRECLALAATVAESAYIDASAGRANA